MWHEYITIQSNGMLLKIDENAEQSGINLSFSKDVKMQWLV